MPPAPPPYSCGGDKRTRLKSLTEQLGGQVCVAYDERIDRLAVGKLD
jgi:hypothetical protein